MDLTKRSGQKPMLRQIEWRVQNGPNTKRSRQKPTLRQIERRVQNGPNTKSGVLPITAFVF